MCVSPIYLIGAKGNRQPVQCGRCFECLVRRREDWCNRIALESEYNSPCVFLTLTYKPEFCDGKLHYFDHIVPFIRNLRRIISPLSYICVGEYGSNTQRPHYHFVIFGHNVGVIDDACIKYWPYGHWDLGSLQYGGAKYVAKYHILAKIGKLPYWMDSSIDIKEHLETVRHWFEDSYDLYLESDTLPVSVPDEFFHSSKGIGKSFVYKNGDKKLGFSEEAEKLQSRVSTHMTINGNIVSIPRYVRNRIFDDAMKEEYKDLMKLRAEKHLVEYCEYYGLEFSDVEDSDYVQHRRNRDAVKRSTYDHKKRQTSIF